MRGESCVFARENAALVGDKLLEQGDILIIQGIKREINFRFGQGSNFRSARLAASRGRLVFRDVFCVA